VTEHIALAEAQERGLMGVSCFFGRHQECQHPEAALNLAQMNNCVFIGIGECPCACHTLPTRFPEGAEL
jgi:hypothetical protein